MTFVKVNSGLDLA